MGEKEREVTTQVDLLAASPFFQSISLYSAPNVPYFYGIVLNF
jgi:hypothetical protein